MSILRESVTDADWLHLGPDDAVRWTGRPSRLTLVRATAIMLILVGIGIALTVVARPLVADQGLPWPLAYLPLVFAVVGIAIGLVAYLNWLRLLYVITDEEIYVKIGLISRDVTQVPLERVQNMAYDQSVLERVLSYGTIRVYTAGTDTDDLSLKSVPNPDRVMEILSASGSEHRGARSDTSGGV